MVNFNIFLRFTAKVTESIAAAGAGLISLIGWNQPSVPKRLAK